MIYQTKINNINKLFYFIKRALVDSIIIVIKSKKHNIQMYLHFVLKMVTLVYKYLLLLLVSTFFVDLGA